MLHVFLVLAHDRRRVVHFNVTAHPTEQWTAQQLRELFPFDQVPRYLLRDRDKIIGGTVPRKDLGSTLCSSIAVAAGLRRARDRLDWARVPGPCGRVWGNFRESDLSSYFSYYHETRPHLSLEKDAPEPRPIRQPELGRLVAVPRVGRLHHRYKRRAA
jgi:hypothetical protein